MVLREEAIRRTLLEIDTVAAELDKYRNVLEDDLRQDLSLRWTVERGLLAGLTLLFNVADHVLAAAFHRYPEKYEESLSDLAACGVISAELRQAMTGAGGFRNVLVHEYVEVDLAEVAAAAAEAPDLYRRFVREVRSWLEARPPGPC